ncbi:MAG TPA: VanZ family protein [Chthonomonadaceae bacterium]|nr:VanZ family protein [Chthonomonadaceae bacterium]
MNKRLLQLFYIGPAIIWMLVIFMGSTDIGNGQHSLSVVEFILRFLAPYRLEQLSPQTLDVLNLVLRKACHVTEYAILTLLVVRAIQFGETRLKLGALAGAAAISALFACSDEIHQRFVPTRGPSPVDVMIDCIGVVLVIIGLLLWFGIKSLERRLRRDSPPDQPQALARMPYQAVVNKEMGQ